MRTLARTTTIFGVIAIVGSLSQALAAAAASQSAADGKIDALLGKPKFQLQQLFTNERFPNVAVAVDGTVLASWGSSSVRIRRSEDGGKTWGLEITIAKPGFQGGGLTVDEGSGDILAFVEERHPPAPIMIFRSKDHGKTWKRHKTVIAKDSNGNLPSMHMNENGITLHHGKHKGRLLRPSRWYAGRNDRARWPQHYTNAIFSDDGGKTWQASAPFPAFGTGEATLAELSNGRIYYNSRRHWAPEGKNPRRRWTAYSDDGGATWKGLSICKALPDGPQNSNYGCMGGLIRLPVKGKDILLYSNCDSPNARNRGTVWASFDGGKTWPVKRLVFKDRFAYSSLNAGRPGTKSEGWIYLHFEGGPKGGSTMARFNLSWVLAGEKTGDGKIPREFRFASLFDGKTLNGWHAVPKASTSDWSVENGVIVGQGSANRLAYLVWQETSLTDFELQLRYRLPGKGNTGVEIRARPDKSGRRPFEGYHADIGHVGIGPNILGAWDFHFAKRREYPCPRGTRLVIDENSNAHPSRIKRALTLADIRKHQWNHARIIARGNNFKFFINGKLASEFTDNAKTGRLDSGAIGLQIHDKGMRVEFKDIRLKHLVKRPSPKYQAQVEDNECSSEQAEARPIKITVTLDRGRDLGQSFGSLFEAKSNDGSLVLGAGFQNAYNTRYRGDRHAIQFFVRPTDGKRTFAIEKLPRPNQLCGTYLYGKDDKVYSTYGRLKSWNPETQSWQIAAAIGGTEETMRLGNGELAFGRSTVNYNGKTILHPPKKGSYQLFFYANGYLCFYHVNRGEDGYRVYKNDADGFSKLYACPWAPEHASVDLSKAVVRTLPVVGETTFAWGRLGKQIVTGSNIGGFYVFKKGRWEMLLEPKLGVSFQLYSTIAFHDRLLMGQYPTGRQFQYDGKKIAELPGWPPKLNGVSGSAREAQTTAIYGGDLFVGVWPWGELWRYNPDSKTWHFMRRMFDHPAVTEKVTHPYDVENKGGASGNQWGQRITSLITMGMSLFISTSAKWPCEWDAKEFPFLAPEKWKSYGAVYRMSVPGHLSATTKWTDGPTTMEFALSGNAVTITQDGKELATATIKGPLAKRLRVLSGLKNVTWGNGIYGRFSGSAIDGSID